jgi:hypothetical protein
LSFSCLFTVHYGTDQRHLFFVSFYSLLDDSNVILEESVQAEGGSPESPEGSDNKKSAGRLHLIKPPPAESQVLFAGTAFDNSSTTKTDSAPAFAANDAALPPAALSSGSAAPTASNMFHPDYKGPTGWGAGGVTGWANNGTTAFTSGTIPGAPGTFVAAFPPANARNAAARVANIGASNTAAPIGTAVFTLRTGTINFGAGTINFGASMSVTADESDAPSDEETAYHSKRSRRN